MKELRVLIRAKISTKRSSSRRVNGCKPCNQMCILCPFIQKTTTHKFERTGREWNIDAPIDCQTPNVIYKLKCKKCPAFGMNTDSLHLLYLGETLRKLKERIADHRGYIISETTPSYWRTFQFTWSFNC